VDFLDSSEMMNSHDLAKSLAKTSPHLCISLSQGANFLSVTGTALYFISVKVKYLVGPISK